MSTSPWHYASTLTGPVPYWTAFVSRCRDTTLAHAMSDDLLLAAGLSVG
ncbi:hypothetical protein [Paraburkholderia piptadeniae]|nr:hypothetical protein [Paraburkholderia piptadeniae]